MNTTGLSPSSIKAVWPSFKASLAMNRPVEVIDEAVILPELAVA